MFSFSFFRENNFRLYYKRKIGYFARKIKMQFLNFGRKKYMTRFPLLYIDTVVFKLTPLESDTKDFLKYLLQILKSKIVFLTSSVPNVFFCLSFSSKHNSNCTRNPKNFGHQFYLAIQYNKKFRFFPESATVGFQKLISRSEDLYFLHLDLRFSLLKFYVIGPTGWHLFGIAHVRTAFIPLQKLHFMLFREIVY